MEYIERNPTVSVEEVAEHFAAKSWSSTATAIRSAAEAIKAQKKGKRDGGFVVISGYYHKPLRISFTTSNSMPVPPEGVLMLSVQGTVFPTKEEAQAAIDRTYAYAKAAGYGHDDNPWMAKHEIVPLDPFGVVYK